MSTVALHPALALDGVGKRFGDTIAVSDCSLAIAPGEVHGLVGANGAGKSTLVRIMSGALEPDEGTLRIGSWSGGGLNPRKAQELGVATIYQEPDLVPSLGAAENIALGRERSRARILVNRRSERADGHALCQRVGAHHRLLGRRVGDLSRADQQLVEIAKALHRDARVILMDEPTAPLGPEDVNRLLQLIRDLASQGVAIVYISHRLPEVLSVADRVTVIRDGRRVWTKEATEIEESHIVTAMIGHQIETRGRAGLANAGDTILSVKGVGHGRQLSDISFDLRAGEVLGLAGLVGAGRSRLLKVIAGAIRPDRGTMTLHGRRYAPRTPADAVRRGVGLLPEDRKHEGLFLSRSVAENICFVRPPSRPPGFIRERDEDALAQTWIERLGITPSDPRAPVSRLSGGNQQKALTARWLQADVDVLLVDEPGQGVDVAGKEQVARIIADAAAAGKAVIVSSSESEELFSLADRLLVLRHGRIVGQLEGPNYSEEHVVGLASGAREGDAVAES